MSDIPDDIMKTAMRIKAECNVDFGGGIGGGAIVRMIADGILAERERCAKVAFDFNDGKHIALDAREGRFPKKSQVKDAIGRTILEGVKQ
jgi:hypothetical protein